MIPPHSLPLTIDCIDYVVYTIYALTLTIDLRLKPRGIFIGDPVAIQNLNHAHMWVWLVASPLLLIPFKYNIEQNRPFSQALSQLASVKRIRVIIDAELRIMNNINALSHA